MKNIFSHARECESDSPGRRVLPCSACFHQACTGFFAQDTPGKLPSDYNAVRILVPDCLSTKLSILCVAQLDKSFGLLDQSPERWSNFKASVDKLNAEAPQGVSYKVFYMSRHG